MAKPETNEQPHATDVRYVPAINRMVVTLSTGLEFLLDPKRTQGLQKASEQSLRHVEIVGPGLGLYFPDLDVDLHVPSLLEGHFGSRKWMAAQIGKAGGMKRTRVKAASSRKNGRLGGRPRKTQAEA